MASIVTICNMALARLGIDQTIENIDDNNNRARACKLFFDEVRDQLLRDYDWNFSLVVLSAALVADTDIPGWQYAYRYPTDCLMLRAISTASGLRLANLPFGFTCTSRDALQTALGKIPFQIQADPSVTGRIVVSDLPEAYFWYTKQITDPNQYDPVFTSALAWRLAGEIGLMVKADPNMSRNAMNMAISVAGQAATDSYSEQAQTDTRVSPSVGGRN